MKLVWLASYPKSGNTWIRFFLYNYLFGEPRKSADVDKKIIDISANRNLDLSATGPLYCKTHFLCVPQHPFIEHTLSAVYIIRNPKDVLLSNLNYFRLRGDDIDDKQFARDFIAHGGVKLWDEYGMGNWALNARSWIGQTRFPHLLLRYEDLKENPREQFTRMLDFLRLEVDNNRLKQAIHKSSFDRLSKLEDKEKSRKPAGVVFSGNQQSTRQGYRFMNKGKSGQRLASIDESLDAGFDEAFAESLAEFGYDRESQA